MDIPTPPQKQGLFQGASPKLTFLFGLISGIAITGLIGLAVIVPLNFRKSTTTASATNTNAAAAVAPTPTNTAQAPSGPVPAVTTADYVRGSGKLTLVEYSDLECPFCKKFHPAMQQAITEYKGKVRFVYRQFPLTSIHQNAQKEAEASLCVGSLGGSDKYWSFIDKIFERSAAGGTGFALTDLGPLAKEVGVSQTKFQDCLDKGTMASRVTDESNGGSTAGVQGTPTSFLLDAAGKTITSFPGAYDYSQIKSAIDSAIAAS